MDLLKQVLNFSVVEISVADILILIGCLVAALLLDKLTQLLAKRLEKRASKKVKGREYTSIFLTSLPKPLHLLFMSIGCSFGLFLIETPSWGIDIFAVIKSILGGIAIWCIVWYLLIVTDKIADLMGSRATETTSKIDDMAVPIIRGLVKFIIISIGVLVIIQNLGYSISSILTGLGIGGAAVALASKDTLANFFGAIVVFIDHPFDLGDWIKLDSVEGTVEEIRMRTTVIRTFDNSIVTIPNSMLSNSSINNYQRRKTRRLDCNFGVLYSTTANQIQQIVSDLKNYVAHHPEMLTPNCYIGLGGFGDSSLDIFVTVYSVKTPWAEFCEVRQTFLLEIMRVVENAGTGFAFPTRTLDLPQMPTESQLNPYVPDSIPLPSKNQRNNEK